MSAMGAETGKQGNAPPDLELYTSLPGAASAITLRPLPSVFVLLQLANIRNTDFPSMHSNQAKIH
jgi:hypothetical protein